MIVETDSLVQDAPPPLPVLRVVNPILRLVLRTPISRAVKALAVLDFTGRHTDQRRQVVVGWHIIGGIPTVITPAPWRINFSDPRLATIRWRGHDTDYIGTLRTDPGEVADAVNALINNGTSARSLALQVPKGHIITVQDITNTRRAIIRFERANARH